MTDQPVHVHGYIRVRKVHPLLIWALAKVGLTRLVVSSGELPHHPDCTPEIAVLEETEL